MKRFDIHPFTKWGIRLGYFLIISGLAIYLGLGLFLKSRLASDLLIKQLSTLVGRPVHIGQVSLDWLHGFHVALKNVEVPSLSGGPPPIFCKSMVATIEIWPFLTRKEITFRHISLKGGVLRLHRNRNGKWRGVVPIPLSTVSRGPEIRNLKKFKRKFILFFPKVSLKDISINLLMETPSGSRSIQMFLKSAETIGSRRTGKIMAQANGAFRLRENAPLIGFKIKGDYRLSSPFPFEVYLNISDLPLEELNHLYKKTSRWFLEGTSQITLRARGKLEGSFNYLVTVKMEKPRLSVGGWKIDIPSKKIAWTLTGEGRNILSGSPMISFKISTPVQPIHAVLLNRGHPVYAQQGLFQGIILKGSLTLFPVHLHTSFISSYRLGSDKDLRRPGHISLRGDWRIRDKSHFSLAFSLSQVPLKAIIEGIKKNEQSLLPLKENSPPPIKIPPLLFLNRLAGSVSGKAAEKRITITSSHITAAWGSSRIGIALSPFRLHSEDSVICAITGSHIHPAAIKATPFILSHLPPVAQKWFQAFNGGELSSLNGKISLKRSPKGKVLKILVQQASVKLDHLSLTTPQWKIPVEDASGKISYRASSLQVSRFQCRVMTHCSVNINQLGIKNIFKRPMILKGDAEITSKGLNLGRDKIPRQLYHLLTFRISRTYSFSPAIFLGKIGIYFNNTLFPFSVKGYEILLKDVLIKGTLTRKNGIPPLPLTLTVTARVNPGNLKVSQSSLVTPFGNIISSGTLKKDPSGHWKVNIINQGQVSLEATNFNPFLPQPKYLSLTGKSPFHIKAQGTWPHLTLHGNVNVKGLFIRYKNLFLKEAGVPSAVNFKIHQTGPKSCEITWIRGKLNGFVIKLWGTLTSFHPLRGEIHCITNTHQFQRLMPFFPRFCHGKECLLAKGDIQCLGQAVLKEPPEYEAKIQLANVSLPFPGDTEPITIAKANILFSDRKRMIQIENLLYKDSYTPYIQLSGNLKDNRWFWNAQVDVGFLDLDELITRFHHAREKKPGGHGSMKKDPFAFFIKLLHGRFIQGSLSIQKLTVLNYTLHKLFMRFQQKGNTGNILGFNFQAENNGYGAIDVTWKESGEETIRLTLSPLVKNLDFGKILDGLLHHSSPFRGWLTFHGTLFSQGGTYQELRDALNGHLDVTFKNGLIARWAVFSSIFRLLNLHDIITLKGLPGFSIRGLTYDIIRGTINVTNGVAKTDDAYLKSQPFFMTGQGTLKLKTSHVQLLIGVYPFKILDTIVSHIPIIGRVFTNNDKKFIGYFFQMEGNVAHPKVKAVNAKKFGERIWNTFRKIITLPFYPFQDLPRPQKKEKR